MTAPQTGLPIADLTALACNELDGVQSALRTAYGQTEPTLTVEPQESNQWQAGCDILITERDAKIRLQGECGQLDIASIEFFDTAPGPRPLAIYAGEAITVRVPSDYLVAARKFQELINSERRIPREAGIRELANGRRLMTTATLTIAINERYAMAVLAPSRGIRTGIICADDERFATTLADALVSELALSM